MPKRGKVLGVLALLLALFTAGSLYLAVRFYLPVSPPQPYFPAVSNRLPQLHWLFGQFQPVFLYPFARGDSGFLRVAYRDPGSQIRLLDVYVGPVRPASSLLGVVINDQPNQISKISDYWRYLRPGTRISLTYLRAVTPRPGTGAGDAVLPSSAQGQEVCARLPALCLLLLLLLLRPGSGRWPNARVGVF